MSPNEVGQLVIALGILSVGSTLIGGGIPQFLARTTARETFIAEQQAPVWFLATLVAVPLAAGVAIAGPLAFPELRSWGVAGVLTLFLLLVTRNLQYAESSLRRATARIVSGAVIQQGALLLATAVLAGVLVVSGSFEPLEALLVVLVAQASLFLTGASNLRVRRLVVDARAIAERVRRDRGIVAGLWLASSLAIAFVWADRLILGFIAPSHELATYQGIVLLVAIFDVIAVGIGFVHLPRYAAERATRPDARLLLGVCAIGTLISLFAALLLGHRLFFIDWTRETIAAFALVLLVGIMKVLYAELSALVGGSARARVLGAFAGFMALSLLAGGAAIALLGEHWGLVGVALGSLMAWSLRVGVGATYMARL
jgi:O-antigen/teichoic acid export membrane protein